MSLINKMLRDLDERHATDAQSTFPGEVRALPESRVKLRGARNIGGILALALLAAAAGGGIWYFTVFSPPLGASFQVSTPSPQIAASLPVLASASQVDSSPAPAPTSLAAPEPEALTEELVPALPTLTSAMPLTPPGMAKPVIATPGQGVQQQRKAVATSVALRLDEMLTFKPRASVDPAANEQNQAKGAGAALQVSSKAPANDPAPHSGAPQLSVVSTDGSVKTEPMQRNSKIEKIERGESGDLNFSNGIHAFKQGRAAEAVNRLQSALQENPRHVAARNALLGILVEQKRWDDALALLKAGLELIPEQSGWAIALARIQVERGDVAAAWGTLQKYQEHAGRNAEYQGFAGVLLQHLKKPHEAAQYFKSALQIEPGEGRWWFTLGNALEADSQPTEALDAYKRAQALGGLTPAMDEIITRKLR